MPRGCRRSCRTVQASISDDPVVFNAQTGVFQLANRFHRVQAEPTQTSLRGGMTTWPTPPEPTRLQPSPRVGPLLLVAPRKQLPTTRHRAVLRRVVLLRRAQHGHGGKLGARLVAPAAAAAAAGRGLEVHAAARQVLSSGKRKALLRLNPAAVPLPRPPLRMAAATGRSLSAAPCGVPQPDGGESVAAALAPPPALGGLLRRGAARCRLL